CARQFLSGYFDVW
nr:immunoglobulin heavy chain junction region [Mus musculus]